MNDSNRRKAEALGMPFGTANNILKKALLFDLAKRLDLDNCYRCGARIERVDQFSIEHKESWFNAKDKVSAFFDLENIAFSHVVCNVRAGAKPHKKYDSSAEQNRASFARYYAKPDQREAHLSRKRTRYAEKSRSANKGH